MSKREADLALVRKFLKAWCETYNADCCLKVSYHADMDNDDSDGE